MLLVPCGRVVDALSEGCVLGRVELILSFGCDFWLLRDGLWLGKDALLLSDRSIENWSFDRSSFLSLLVLVGHLSRRL